MRTLPLVGLLVVSLSTFAGAAVRGSGVTLTQKRDVVAFSAIEASGGVKLEVKRGPTSVTVEGDDNLVPLISTEVHDGVLIIKRKRGELVWPDVKLVVRVSTPSLSRLEASGGVNATLVDVAAPKFSAELSGGVELHARDLALESLTLDASGGVTADLSGKVKAARLSVSGGVGVKGKALSVAQVTLDASGGCDVELTATESISGEVSGGANIAVHGHPPKSRVDTSGGADVNFLN